MSLPLTRGIARRLMGDGPSIDEARIRADQTRLIIAWLRSDVTARMAWQFTGEHGAADAIAREFGESEQGGEG